MGTARKLEYIYDEAGKKRAVIIPLKKYEQLLMDLDDLKTIEKRRNETSKSFAEIRKRGRKV